MDIQAELTVFGLSEPESRVYMAVLQLGTDTVLNIAKHAGVKRPSTYNLLAQLEQRGLVSKQQDNHRVLYTAEDPEQLVQHLTVQQRRAQRLLPSLRAIHNGKTEKPTIRMAEGIEQVRTVYNQIFTYLDQHPKNELLIFGSLSDATHHFETEVIDYFYNSMHNTQNPVREIGNDDAITRSYYKRAKQMNRRHEIRLTNDETLFQDADNFIYGNTLVMLSVTDHLFAVTVESPGIVSTYRSLFEMAWRTAAPIS